MILSCFAAAFPVLVFGVFVRILLSHPGNLYPPDQYTSVTTIEGYVAALHRDSLASQNLLERAIREAISVPGVADPNRNKNVELALGAVDHVLKTGSVTVVREKLVPGAKPVRFAVSDETSVQDLLDAIYFALDGAVATFSYGRDWWVIHKTGMASQTSAVDMPPENSLGDAMTEASRLLEFGPATRLRRCAC